MIGGGVVDVAVEYLHAVFLRIGFLHGYYSIRSTTNVRPTVRMSVCPSIRPSVRA